MQQEIRLRKEVVRDDMNGVGITTGSSYLLGEFLVRQGAITAEQLFAALEWQQASFRLLNLMASIEQGLDRREIETILKHAIETSKSIDTSAADLGFISRAQIEETYSEDHNLRVPLGKILVQQGSISSVAEMAEWLRQFRKYRSSGDSLVSLILSVPLFKGLTVSQAREIVPDLMYEQREAGEIIYRENDTADALYLVEKGLVRLSLRTPDGLKEIAACGPAQHFGLNGTIAGHTREHRAEAITKTDLLRLDRNHLASLLRDNPEISYTALKQMSSGISAVFRAAKGLDAPRKLTVVTLFFDSSNQSCIDLAKQTIQLILRTHRNPIEIVHSLAEFNPDSDPFARGGTPGQQATCRFAPELTDADSISELLLRAHQHARSKASLVLVVDANGGEKAVTQLLEQSKRTAILISNPASHLLGRLQVGRDRLYIFPGEPALDVVSELRRNLTESCRGFFPQAIDPAKVSDRLRFAGRIARWLGGNTLGVAFGGGGARILAHVGLLRLLESEGVEIDEVAGSSGGSVIAGMVALGWASSKIKQLFIERLVNARKNPLVDLVLPIKSMARARRFEELLKVCFGNTRVYETEIPFFPVATDMKRACEFYPRFGPIWLAAKASAAIPGFHPLVDFDGVCLGDGGLLNNVPGSVLRQFGSAAVIGSNITPDPAHSDFNSNRLVPALIQGIDIMLFAATERNSRCIDLEFRPQVEGYSTTNFSVGNDLLRIGEEESERRLHDVRRLIRTLAAKGF
ncbi:MAG: patatin-like phospholipase family protein [Leptospirales bacterium]|nr:patatin-like phospholipase family protein [Leptospirales bacterium]